MGRKSAGSWSYMDARLFFAAIGVAVTLGGGLCLAYPLLRPEVRRREGLITAWVNEKGTGLGLRGRYIFGFDKWSPRGSVGSGSYTPADDADRLLWDRIGGGLSGEAIGRANSMLLTDRRLAAVGIVLLVIGASVAIGTAFV